MSGRPYSARGEIVDPEAAEVEQRALDEQCAADREALGRRVREVWTAWAREQPSPKASWLVPWEDLTEPEREVDRRIGEALAARGLAQGLAWGHAALQRALQDLSDARREVARFKERLLRDTAHDESRWEKGIRNIVTILRGPSAAFDVPSVVEWVRELHEKAARPPAPAPAPAPALAPAPAPEPMILTCPSCGERHIDEGEFATKAHHTHACQSCGMVWRPAVCPTVGVRFLPGYGPTVRAQATFTFPWA